MNKRNRLKISNTLCVFQRSDRGNDKFYAGIKLPKNYKGDRTRYKYPCLHTLDLQEAIRKAGIEEQRLEFRKEHGYPVHTKNFETSYKEWISKIPHVSEKRRYTHLQNAERYFFEYFNDRELGMIDEPFIDDYWAWRQTINAKREKEGTLSIHSKTTVAPATLYMEKDSLNSFFKWAAKRNLIKRKPEIEMPMKNQRNRRPTFSLDEYKQLLPKMREWANGVDPFVQKQQFYQRQLIRHAFQFCCYSGLRTKELFLLKYKDISYFIDDNGTKQMLIQIDKNTKTGYQAKPRVPMLLANAVLQRWINGTKIAGNLYELAKHTDDDDYIFGNYWGRYFRGSARATAKMFNHAGLRLDVSGAARSFYSGRHFYASHRLLFGLNTSVFKLAENMGTSVEMIEKHYGQLKNQQNAVELTSKKKPARKKIVDANEATIIPFPTMRSA
jgi:integrase